MCFSKLRFASIKIPSSFSSFELLTAQLPIFMLTFTKYHKMAVTRIHVLPCTSCLAVYTTRGKRRFHNDPLWRALSKSFVSGDRKRSLRVDAYPKRIKRCVFKNIRIRADGATVSYQKHVSRPRLRERSFLILDTG